MPTVTFLNLPQEKKNKIIEAIKSEFARVPFEKVSINKIIQEAGISRGSFYMYFKDKKDMLVYILSNYSDMIKSTIKESFKQNNGDVFAAFSDILKFTAEFGTAKENISFCINIFSNHTVQNDILSQFVNCNRNNEYFDWFKPYIDTRNLNLRSPNDVDDIIDILVSITQKAIGDIFLNIEKKDQISKRFKNKLTILKHGILKENL